MWLLNDPRIQASLLKHSILWPKKYNAPWVPTPSPIVRAMLELAEAGPDDQVYDLGCGDGRIPISAAQNYGSRAVGIEIDPLRYAWCQVLITTLRLRDRIRIIYGDFFIQDLSKADVVTCYLLPETNEKLSNKFKSELRADTRIVSHNFPFPELTLLGKDEEHNILLYQVGSSKGGPDVIPVDWIINRNH